MAPVLAWTVCAYRKEGLSEDEYHSYMSEIHGPLVKGLMAKYGMLSFSMAQALGSLPHTPDRTNERSRTTRTRRAPRWRSSSYAARRSTSLRADKDILGPPVRQRRRLRLHRAGYVPGYRLLRQDEG